MNKRQHFMSSERPKADPNYNTPDWLFALFDKEFDFKYDLAAIKENAKKEFFEDSLPIEWHKLNGWLWLNPPFAGIRQWIEKSYNESRMGAKIVVLAPVTVLGSPYMATHSPDELRFHAGCPAFKNTFTDKVIRFMPALMIFDTDRRERKFYCFPKRDGK